MTNAHISKYHFGRWMMRITLVIHSLSCGGAERVLSTMANYWSENGIDVTLITLESADQDHFKLHENIRRWALSLAGTSRNIFSALANNYIRLRKLRKAILSSRPDVLISFQEIANVLTILSTFGTRLPVIVSERNEPNFHRAGAVWEYLRTRIYPFADIVVVQTTAVANWAKSYIRPEKIKIIPNPIHSRACNYGDLDSVEFKPPFAIAIGRLTPQKGIDLLLKAFSQCRHSNLALVIFGEGEQKQNLLEMSERLGVSNRVFFPGITGCPQYYLRQATFFVLASRYEGFPNALLEAMACSVPVISFNCPNGPSEIINSGYNGILVPAENTDKLAAAMDHLMEHEDERHRLGEHAGEVVTTYSIDKVMQQWDSILRSILP